MKTRILAALAAAALAAPALATGPLANCASGVPYRWDVSAGIPFNPDQGDLGPLTHALAVSAVQSAFDTWGDVPSSSASYVQGPLLPVDVDITNFMAYYDAPAPDGLSAIVFDHTGEIFDLLYGPGSGVLGFAGPEWGDSATCTITEGLSFLNGPSFDDLVAATDVMVHEFGHYSNLAHTAVNGQIFLAGDSSGPTPYDTFGAPADITVIETMYPFYFGPGSGTQTLEADDVSGISALYPEPGHDATTGAIEGTIYASDGATRLSGVNVVARNVADPFLDAVSAVSGDRTDSTSQADPYTGTYRLSGLTPGAQYAVYVDQILAGGFSTAPITLPHSEEFHSGAAESNNGATPDDPSTYAPVAVAAGATSGGVDVIFNTYQPGDALPVGDDGAVQLALPFTFPVCGEGFQAVYVNGNGSLTFGGPSTDFTESANELLSGRPRIAGLWDDLDPDAGGVVTYAQSASQFTVRYEEVPEFGTANANTFAITLKPDGRVTLTWGDLAATDGLVGVSCGGVHTSGFENESSLRRAGTTRNTASLRDVAAAFEIFTAADNALDGYEVMFHGSRDLPDAYGGNDGWATATPVSLPFSSAGEASRTELAPAGGDVDYFRIQVSAGDFLALEVMRGSFDSVLGVFDATTGALLAADDDSGGGLLSRLLLQANVDLDLAVAVSAFPDLDFTGAGEGGGRYVLEMRRYAGTRIAAGDDTSTEVALPFAFPFAGRTFGSVFVNSNGNLTFGGGSGDFSESVAELLSGPPRVAPLWDDLDASRGLVVVEDGPIATAVHFVSVPEFGSDAGNYFAVGLTPGGSVGFQWGATSRGDALVGRSVGEGAAAVPESDLSAGALPVFGGPTLFEQFSASSPPEPFDLNHRAAIASPAP